MIASLFGKVKYKGDGVVALEVSGVGYEVRMRAADIEKIHEGDEVELFTHLQISEKDHALYGFASRDRREVFRLLLTVSGIGPKSALGILEKISLRELSLALRESNAASLRAFGIGAKIAERLVVELSGKADRLPADIGDGQAPSALGDADVIEALKGLGYSLPEARDAARNVPRHIRDAAERMKHALRSLTKR